MSLSDDDLLISKLWSVHSTTCSFPWQQCIISSNNFDQIRLEGINYSILETSR